MEKLEAVGTNIIADIMYIELDLAFDRVKPKD